MIQKQEKLPIAVSTGESAGIGPEICLKAWLKKEKNSPIFFLIGDFYDLEIWNKSLNLGVPLNKIEEIKEIRNMSISNLNILHVPLISPTKPGAPTKENSTYVLNCILKAVESVQLNYASALVTCPIQKDIIYSSGFNYPGVTEFLGSLSGQIFTPVMMLTSQKIRTVPITTHISVSNIAKNLSVDLIVKKSQILYTSLKNDFNIEFPKIVVAGLNPHAGENGSIGNEEKEYIIPALNILNDAGLNICGPLSADSIFHDESRKNYDAIICMYHDQALIPVKMISFWEAVNITLGLPFVRTSPDHGTGIKIAGKNTANPSSLISAINLASIVSKNRKIIT